MTTRERREARAEKRREWAESREAKAEAASQQVSDVTSIMPLGEPIHDGSRGARQRAAGKRLRATESKAVEHAEMARRHKRAAKTIEEQLQRAVFSDDPDAITRLAERIADNEAKREAMKARNAEFRRENRERLKQMTSFGREQAMPHPPYELANLGSAISRDRKRLEQLRRDRSAA